MSEQFQNPNDKFQIKTKNIDRQKAPLKGSI